MRGITDVESVPILLRLEGAIRCDLAMPRLGAAGEMLGHWRRCRSDGCHDVPLD